jgi:hypothetical protein
MILSFLVYCTLIAVAKEIIKLRETIRLFVLAPENRHCKSIPMLSFLVTWTRNVTDHPLSNS